MFVMPSIPLADAFTNRRERAVLDQRGDVNAIAFSPDGTRLAVASDDPSALVWDVGTGRRLFPLGASDGAVTSIEFSKGRSTDRHGTC